MLNIMLMLIQDVANLGTVSDHCHDHNNVKLLILNNNNNNPDQASLAQHYEIIEYKIKSYCHQAELQQSWLIG